MACPHFHWEHNPLLEIWREKHDKDGNPNIVLESYSPEESISIFKEALSSNTVSCDLLLCQMQINETRNNLQAREDDTSLKFEIVKFGGDNFKLKHYVRDLKH